MSLNWKALYDQVPPTLVWPFEFCAATTVFVYVLSVITGNVSQVDRLWTFLPTIYTAYFALLPLWPRVPQYPLFPYTPDAVDSRIVGSFSPRALVMLGLVVSRSLTLNLSALITVIDFMDVPVRYFEFLMTSSN